MNRSEEAFALNKAPHIAEAIVRNASLLSRCAPVLPGTLDLAIVVGGGHTMPDDLPTDAPIIVGNSAVRGCLSRGAVPDFIVCRESIDMSTAAFLPLKAHTKKATAVLDIGCSHKTWLTALEVCERVLWFVPASTQTFGIAATLGVAPLYGGQTNVTASVAVAAVMGARRIDMFGASRAFSADGFAYAKGNDGWDSVRLESVSPVVGPDGEVDHYLGHIAGTEKKAALHEASGQRPPLKVERVVPLVAVDGSTRWALEPTADSQRWLENFAARHPRLELHQHNPDVAIAGWGHAPRKDAEADEDDLVADMRGQVDHALAVSMAVREGGSLWEVPRMLEGSPIVDYHGIGARLTMMQAMRGRGPAAMIPALYRTTDEAAERVRGWLDGRVSR